MQAYSTEVIDKLKGASDAHTRIEILLRRRTTPDSAANCWPVYEKKSGK